MIERIGVAVIGAGDYAADPDAPSSWRYTGTLGSGALADLGSHLIDLAEQLCGPITAIRGATLPIVATFADGLRDLQVQRAIIEAPTTGSTAEVTL